MAWETTIEDVVNVLEGMAWKESHPQAVLDNLDCEEVAKAALTETEFEKQVAAAYQEIENQIREKNLASGRIIV